MTSLDSKSKYKVKFGLTTDKSRDDVKNFIKNKESSVGRNNPNNLDLNQEINDDLLQIISSGIDEIVLKLKNKLGSNFDESNQNAKYIIEKLDNIKEDVNTKISNIGKTSDTIDTDARQIIYANNNYNVSNDSENPNFYTNGIKYDEIKIRNGEDFKNLKSIPIDVIPNQSRLIENDQDINIKDIENRLKNCQNLEILYLKKHDEIMKIFEFTLNLFNKFKYAIKIILFLLKHLVYKDNKAGTESSTDINDKDTNKDKTIKINLPLPIISNIKKLVDDQSKVQEVINTMKDSIKDENINSILNTGDTVKSNIDETFTKNSKTIPL